MALLLAARTFRDGSSTGVSSILMEHSDLELTNTTVNADAKCDCGEKGRDWGLPLQTGRHICLRVSSSPLGTLDDSPSRIVNQKSSLRLFE